VRYFVDRAPGFHPKFLGAQEFTRKRHLDPFIRFDNVNTCKKVRMFAVRTVKTRHPLDVGVLVTDKIVLVLPRPTDMNRKTAPNSLGWCQQMHDRLDVNRYMVDRTFEVRTNGVYCRWSYQLAITREVFYEAYKPGQQAWFSIAVIKITNVAVKRINVNFWPM